LTKIAYRKKLTASSIVLLVVLVVLVWVGQSNAVVEQDTTVYQSAAFNVYDGDTFHATIAGKDERIRLTGVDTPEMDDTRWKSQAEIAKLYTQNAVDGKTVWLEVDNDAQRDRYDRILAYVWLVDPMTLGDKHASCIQHTLNGQLLASGYAKALTIKPNITYAADFEACAARAEANEDGFWSSGVFGS